MCKETTPGVLTVFSRAIRFDKKCVKVTPFSLDKPGKVVTGFNDAEKSQRPIKERKMNSNDKNQSGTNQGGNQNDKSKQTPGQGGSGGSSQGGNQGGSQGPKK